MNAIWLVLAVFALGAYKFLLLPWTPLWLDVVAIAVVVTFLVIGSRSREEGRESTEDKSDVEVDASQPPSNS
jgi:membrane protein implicated in regulation of membrane protease activity